MSYTSETSAQTSATESQTIHLGQVKWFNAKAGYGYITVMKGDKKGEDVFVHHSAINVVDRMYKYLVQGEYVDISIGKSQSPDHEFQVSTVAGLGDGKLMCETRFANQRARPRQAGAAPRQGGRASGGRGAGRRATPRRDGSQQESTASQEVTVDTA
jgi:cold shock CspA family protein